MDDFKHFALIARHVYYLDKEDYVYVSAAMTGSLNWMIPGFVGPWMVKRLYLIGKKNVARSTRVPLALLPAVMPFVSWYAMYIIYYRNDDRIEQLFKKYPKNTDFRARPKINPFRFEDKSN
jgi:hypothetical protein